MPRKVGRPLKEIDWDQFEKLCGIHATLNEMSAWFRVSVDTIERACLRHYGKNFAEVHEEKKGLGKISLRRKMFEIAMNGNVGMLIWLSKQMLGYAEKQEVKNDVVQNIKIEPITALELKSIAASDPMLQDLDIKKK